MKIVSDMHTHTIGSDHAYSTIQENCAEAAKKGLFAIAMTDHGCDMIDSPKYWHFSGAHVIIPRKINGVYVFRGIEANLLNSSGETDAKRSRCDNLDFVIVSAHEECFSPETQEDVTNAYINLMDKGRVELIGHMGTAHFKCDYEAVVKKCAETGTLIEINSASFRYRLESLPNCREIAKLCMKYNVGVMVNSDCHISFDIGNVEPALNMLHELNFPEKLLVNGSIESLAKYFKDRRGLDILE